jgi:glycerol uptake facilitator protein
VEQPSLLKRAIAEMIGTWVLVFLGTGSVVTMVVFFKSFRGVDQAALLLIGISFGVAVLVMIYAFGHISGTHINPAVSIALFATGRLPAADLLAYVVAQLLGAFLASTTIYALWGARAVDAGLGITLPGVNVSYTQAIFVEIVLSFFLGLAIWGSAVDSRAPGGFAGLAIGLVVAADIWVGGPLTGASMNPARSFGPFVGESAYGGTAADWAKYPIYIIGPIVGLAAAAFVYDYVAELKKRAAEPHPAEPHV